MTTPDITITFTVPAEWGEALALFEEDHLYRNENVYSRVNRLTARALNAWHKAAAEARYG